MKHYSDEEKENNNDIIGTVANADLVNVRENPNFNSKILAVVGKGEKFKKTIPDLLNGFHKIYYEGDKTGYIHQDYFKV